MTKRIRAVVRLNLPKIDPLYVWSALIGFILALALIAIGTVLNQP
jgi:hypothetical protein